MFTFEYLWKSFHVQLKRFFFTEGTVTFEELSQELRKARLAKKWRPRDIARRTCIQYEFIKLIESGDFTFMPDPIIRGYIKSYARDVGLNQNEMIEKYEQANANVEIDTATKPASEEVKSNDKKEEKKKVVEKVEIPKTTEPPKEVVASKTEKVERTKEEKKEKPAEKEEGKKEPASSSPTTVVASKVEPERKQSKKEDQKKETASESIASEIVAKKETPTDKKTESVSVQSNKVDVQKSEGFFQKFRSELILVGILLIVVIAIALIYFKFGTDYFTKEEEPVKKISVFEAREQHLDEKSAQKAEQEKIRVPDTVKLRILAAERTWVRMVSDSTDTTEYMFSPGSARSFEAKNQIELKMGRADGLFIWVNEDSVGKLGTAAEIVGKLVVSPQGIITKEIRAPKPSQPAKKDTTVTLLP